MKVLEVLKIRKYFLIAAVSAVAFASIYIYTQVLGILENLDVWFATAPPINLLLFAIFSILFGVTLSFQIYNWRQPKTCRIDKKSISAASGATFIGFLVAQCPACASLGSLLLPSSVFLSVFVKYNTLINLLSIGLLVFTINYLGGFQKGEKEIKS